MELTWPRSISRHIQNASPQERPRRPPGHHPAPDQLLALSPPTSAAQNLFNLANAAVGSCRGGRVEVAASPSNGHVEIAVTDTGIGIAEEDRDVIFEEFRQVGASEGHPREGTGLGLPLAKRLVELHGGRIWLESKPGYGSTFTFTIPLR
jgi:signal transduction histidine kinase